MSSRRKARTAKKVVKEKRTQLEQLRTEHARALEQLDWPLAPSTVPLTALLVAPRKSDVDVDDVQLAWLPWREAADGKALPAYKVQAAASPSSGA